jgi:hypothetical protein
MMIAGPALSDSTARIDRPSTRVPLSASARSDSAPPLAPRVIVPAFIVSGRNLRLQKTTLVECTGCKKPYHTALKEAVRSCKKGRPLYCSHVCCSAHTKSEDPQRTVALWITEPWLQEAYADAYRHARKGAPKRKKEVEFALTKGEYNEKIRASDNRCAISGILFNNSIKRTLTYDRRPFIPSIDRIDSTKGYTADNIRIVCCITNMAMMTWGEQPLFTLAKHLMAKLHKLTVEALEEALAGAVALKSRNKALDERIATLEARLSAAGLSSD